MHVRLTTLRLIDKMSRTYRSDMNSITCLCEHNVLTSLLRISSDLREEGSQRRSFCRMPITACAQKCCSPGCIVDDVGDGHYMDYYFEVRTIKLCKMMLKIILMKSYFRSTYLYCHNILMLHIITSSITALKLSTVVILLITPPNKKPCSPRTKPSWTKPGVFYWAVFMYQSLLTVTYRSQFLRYKRYISSIFRRC